MTMDRTRLIDEARTTLQDYHGDREADDVTLIDAVDALAALAGLTYFVDDNGQVTLDDAQVTSRHGDSNVRFLPGDGGDARPCVVVDKVQVYSYIGETGRLQVSIDTDDADRAVPIDIAVNGTGVASLPDTITELAELEALPVGSLIKLPDGEVGMVMMVARDKRHVIGYPGTLPADELPDVIRGTCGDSITVVWRSGQAR